MCLNLILFTWMTTIWDQSIVHDQAMVIGTLSKWARLSIPPGTGAIANSVPCLMGLDDGRLDDDRDRKEVFPSPHLLVVSTICISVARHWCYGRAIKIRIVQMFLWAIIEVDFLFLCIKFACINNISVVLEHSWLYKSMIRLFQGNLRIICCGTKQAIFKDIKDHTISSPFPSISYI